MSGSGGVSGSGGASGEGAAAGEGGGPGAGAGSGGKVSGSGGDGASGRGEAGATGAGEGGAAEGGVGGEPDLPPRASCPDGFLGYVRDFTPETHPDFEPQNPDIPGHVPGKDDVYEAGIVAATVDPNWKPVYASDPTLGTITTTGAASFERASSFPSRVAGIASISSGPSARS